MVRFLGLLGLVAAIFFSLAAADLVVLSFGWANFWGYVVLIGALVYVALGIIKISIGHKGVPLFFGRRLLKKAEVPAPPMLPPMEWEGEEEQGRPRPQVPEEGLQKARFLIPEGWTWLPWIVLGSEDVDVREETVKVDEFVVVSSYERNGQQNFVRLTVRPSVIRFKVKNPGQSLSVGMDTIRTGARELLQNIIRSYIAGTPPEVAIRATDRMRGEAERMADSRAAWWGVDITEILIGEVAFPESVQRDYERVLREEKQRDAETIELNHVAERINDITATLVRTGIPVERAAERAVEIVQRERGKAAISEQRIALSPETLEALGPFVKTLVGRQRKKKEEQGDESD